MDKEFNRRTEKSKHGQTTVKVKEDKAKDGNGKPSKYG